MGHPHGGNSRRTDADVVEAQEAIVNSVVAELWTEVPKSDARHWQVVIHAAKLNRTI